MSTASLLTLIWFACTSASGEQATQVERRLARTAHYLAADELAGRGIGTPQIDLAADYLRREFERLGLATSFQTFTYTKRAEQGPNNRAAFVSRASGERIGFTVERDFRPLAIGSAGNFEVPVVFAGYGITAPEFDYDDYTTIDVKGKAVVVLRHEPQQTDRASRFNGTDDSVHAPFRRKVQNAIEHGAACVVFCTDQVEVDRRTAEAREQRNRLQHKLDEQHRRFSRYTSPTSHQLDVHRKRLGVLQDRIDAAKRRQSEATSGMLAFEGAGQSSAEPHLPVLIASRQAIDGALVAAGSPTLAELEREIDRYCKPRSFALDNWRLVANVDITREQVPIKNVVAVLEGDGPTDDETIVIGAHYDHVGYGMGVARGKGPIHNGADDNASGVSVLVELAGHYASLPTLPPRRMVFVAFTGEERGLLGSEHYIDQPVAPLDSTIAMFNFDMVGRLTDNRLIVSGTETAVEFSYLVDAVNERHGFELVKVPGGRGPSDHANFYAKRIPVLHFFTGLHNEYHRPSDDVELLNVAGMRRVATYAQDVVDAVLHSPVAPTYAETDGPSRVD